MRDGGKGQVMGEQPERPVPPQEKEPTNTIYMWACLCHFSAILGLIWWLPIGALWIPFGHILGPLVVWLFQRKLDPFVNDAGKESLNFQIMMTLYGVALATPFNADISRSLIMGLVIVDVYYSIAAGLRCSKGVQYRHGLIFWRIIT